MGKITVFKFNSNNCDKKDKKVEIKVEYICDGIVKEDKYNELYNSFINYLSNNKRNDIVEVVVKVRNIFNGLNERELKIRLEDKEYIQEVKYSYGRIDTWCLKYDKKVEVKLDNTGSYIKYNDKKNNVKDLARALEEIKNFTFTSRILCDLGKTKEKVNKLKH